MNTLEAILTRRSTRKFKAQSGYPHHYRARDAQEYRRTAQGLGNLVQVPRRRAAYERRGPAPDRAGVFGRCPAHHEPPHGERPQRYPGQLGAGAEPRRYRRRGLHEDGPDREDPARYPRPAFEREICAYHSADWLEQARACVQHQFYRTCDRNLQVHEGGQAVLHW